MINVSLTQKEALVLFNHYYQDYQYGVSGTWGDGENWTSGRIARADGMSALIKLQAALDKHTAKRK